MNQSRYQELLAKRFGQKGGMTTVKTPGLDAFAGASEANRELSLGAAGLNKKRMDNSTRFANQQLGLSRHNLSQRNKAFQDEKSNMNAANWVSGAGVALGLGQGLNEARQYRELTDMLNKQKKALVPPVQNYGYEHRNYKFGLGGR